MFFDNLLELHTIELKKFSDNPKEEFAELMLKINTALDRWTAFLAKYELLEKNKNKTEDVNIKKALEVIRVMNFNKQEKYHYDNHLKWQTMEAGVIKEVIRYYDDNDN